MLHESKWGFIEDPSSPEDDGSAGGSNLGYS